MSSHASTVHNFSMKSYGTHDEQEDERQGLLTDAEILDLNDAPLQASWSRKRITIVATCLLVLIVSGYLAGVALFTPSRLAKSRLHFNGDTLRSNGTHNFKRTVLLVSIDGLRADYLDRGLTPHLLDISKQGIRAKHLTPVFPTLTFPNHWSLLTGLYAESHGIIANNFWDPVTDSEFHYNSATNSWNSSWWFGEPIWETANKAGLITANLMWPGPPKTMSGSSPTYFIPWKDKVDLSDKLDQICEWIDLPLEKRPQLIMAYEPSLDQAGHAAGPNSRLVNETLQKVDIFAKDLHTSLKSRNLTEILDVIFVSDHGMTDTSHPEPVFVDDILGDGFDKIEHEDGWPSMGIRFHPGVNESYYLDLLLEAADAHPDKFNVYTHETMPRHYHFSNNPRIAPIWIVPNIGYVLMSHKEEGTVMSKGNHGYDNYEMSMQAMFVAHGPFSALSKIIRRSRSLRLFSRALTRPNKGWHSVADDTYVMDGFRNTELYGLVVKLLGLEKYSATTNGTKGFWDPYF